MLDVNSIREVPFFSCTFTFLWMILFARSILLVLVVALFLPPSKHVEGPTRHQKRKLDVFTAKYVLLCAFSVSSSLTLKVWQSLNQDFLWKSTAPEDPLAVGPSNHHVSLTTSAAVSYIEQTPSSTPDLQGALTSALKCGQSTGIKVLLGGSRRGLSESSASAQWPSCP